VQNFEWIVFFDKNTPRKYHAEIDRLRTIYPFRPTYTPMFEMDRICPEIISTQVQEEWLLTTRLDSDDVLARDHVERLVKAFKWQGRELVNFTNGTILSLERGKAKLYEIQDRANPFASLLEPFGRDIKTIWWEHHVDIGRMAPIIQIGGAPAWMQIVHGGNVSNRVKGRRIRRSAHIESLPLLESFRHRRDCDLDIELENMFVTPLRAARELGWTFFKRVRGAVTGGRR
jgi:hypothetical protein